MPSLSHPQAQFVPVPLDLDLNTLVESTSNFDYVTRLPYQMLKEHSIQHLEQLVLLHVVIGGKPLVIENWGDVLDPWLFSPEWLQQHMGKKAENVRDVTNAVDIPMTVGHYLKSMPQLTNQFTASNYRDPKRQRLYLKDIDCPEEWAKELKDLIPETFYYLNDCIEPRTGGDGAVLEPNEYGQMKYGKGVAPAGDLMSSLPKEMQALNMMCYIGHEGTYTPAHREMCASLGHNVMVEASQDGNGEKAGSSIWFMTETKEREVVSEYFLSMLGHDIEVERHFAQVNAWKKAPFNVWVVEQKLGDLILVPPLAPHQVWNRGTRTMKAAWNRTTVDTLELALHEALPRARLVCREEQYKNKAIIYFTLIKYHEMLQRDTIEPKMWRYGRIKQLLEDFKRLFALYTEMLVSEMFASILPSEQEVELLPYDSNVTCSYCRCNIFNRFLTCKTCVESAPTGEEDAYDVCMECFAMGRSCGCISNLKWVEQWDWSVLTGNYEEWRNVIVQCDGYFDTQKSPQPLDVARKRYGRKPVAHVCQEQLKNRPWHDITKPYVRDPSPGDSDVEPEADDEGRPKKKTLRKTKNGRVTPAKNKTHACHICCHHDWNWRLAFCSTCKNAYCYGVLWRAFDLMPQDVMEDRDWSCPKCQGICSCGKCRKSPTQKPYAPKGTLLGHDTRKVADFRSVESLVDFSRTNLGWLRGENDHNPQESARMKRLREKAEEAKAKEDVIDENYLDADDQQMINADAPFEDDGQIDPQLRGHATSSTSLEYDGHNVPTHPAINGDSLLSTPGAAESQDCLNGNYHTDFDSRPEADYPSKLLGPIAPVAPMYAVEQSNEQSHPGHNRMMGIGYYQQGNSTDRILYDRPNSDSASDGPQNVTVSTTANFALSDLLQPQVQDEGPKKRKNGPGSDGEDDLEFFTSKKQKRLAKAKRSNGNGETAGDGASKPAPPQRPPRLSAKKSHTYVDLGEEAAPLSEADIVVLSSHKPKTRVQESSDVELARQAMHHLKKSSASEQVPRRRSGRGQLPATTASPDITKPTRRKSAWLDRKEAEVANDDSVPTPPKRRGRPPQGTTRTTSDTPTVVDSSSDSQHVDDDSDYDSLFGDLKMGKKSVRQSTKRHQFEDSVDVQTKEDSRVARDQEEQAQNPTPKRRGRGRPRKSDTAPRDQPTQLLSLKEKLALKGKSAKIVSAKSRPSLDTLPKSISRSATSEANLLASSKASPAASLSFNEAAYTPEPGSSEPAGRMPNPTKSSKEGTVVSAAPAQPVKKGPTVVRLSSPSSHADDLSDMSVEPTMNTSSDDDDESIPAVRPLRKGTVV